MKKVSINELKKGLSSILTEVGAGAEVTITRHNRPVARLSAAERQHLHSGSRFGKASLQPVLGAKTRGRYLKVLLEDRQRGTDGR